MTVATPVPPANYTSLTDAITSLNTISRAVCCDSAPRVAHRPMPNGGEHALDRVGRAQMIPVLGRDVIKDQQRLPILGQAGYRLLVFGGILVGERRDGRLGRRAVRRRPDLAQVGLGGGLHGLGQLVEHVGRLVHRAALVLGRG